MSAFRKDALLLVIIVVIGAALRFNGLFWDTPYFFNPDEKRLIDWGMTLNYVDPGISEWGILPLLLIKSINEGLDLFYTPTRADIYPLARVFSVLLGCVTILLVYRLAQKGYGRQAGLYAAVFTTFTVLHIQYAHFYNLDTIFAFFILVALFPILNVARTGNIKSYMLSGLAIGLAITVRLNGIFLFAPLAIAHGFSAYRLNSQSGVALAEDKVWRRRPAIFLKSIISKKLWLAFLAGIGIFVLLTPSSILNPEKYLFHDGLVWILLQSKGYIKSQYTLQFEGTTPWFYFSNLLFWAAGPFLLLAYGAGFIYAIFKWRKPENLIILSFLLIYFWTAADARVKFIRYVLPILPLLNIMAAEFFASVQHMVREKPTLRWAMAGWLGLTVIGSALYALAFANIYSLPDIRVIAAQWIQANLPGDSVIVHENDVIYAPPLAYYDPEQTQYRFREINLNELYESSALNRSWSLPAFLDNLDVEISRRGKSPVLSDLETGFLSDEQKQQYLRDRIYCADYIILSDRHYSVYRDKMDLFPIEGNYYHQLFKGMLAFRPVKVFEQRPNLFGWSIDDSQAELTFRIFDHPTIWIFQAQLPADYLEQHPPQTKTQANWADQIRLVGYDINNHEAQPGESVELTLYWQVLADMNLDYTIFLQLQDDTQQIVAQNDYQVAEGMLPTSCWLPGRIILDTTNLSIPTHTPVGNYHLKLGLYYFETLERLPLVQDIGGENALSLDDVQILK